MSGVFNEALKNTLTHEGGFVDNPADPGGATKWGISLRFLRAKGVQAGDIDGDGDVDKQDIESLRPGHAEDFYRKNFWDKYHYACLPVDLAKKVFDMAVNMGPGQAHKLLQRACNEFGAGLVVDGVIGSKTRAMARTMNEGELLSVLRRGAINFYFNLAKKKPELALFLHGWCRRAAF